jgi:23S rRNA (uracil1939-C5)-methyltransferase
MPLQVLIEKLVYGGEGLARTGEGIVLVPGVLPGESVSIELEPAKRGVRRARLLEVLSPSPHRLQPRCPFFNECGGCQHQQAAYEQQVTWKADILRECFERIGKMKLAGAIDTISAEPWEYRNRIRLHARKEDGQFALDSCAISSPAIQDAVKVLASGELFGEIASGDFEIELFATDMDRELMGTITSNVPPTKNFGDLWMTALPNFTSINWARLPGSSHRRHAHPKPMTWGGGGLTVRVSDFHFRVSHGSFFQTNRYLLQAMMEAATGNLQGERALDLYAGVGFFTLPLTRRFNHVVAVESHSTAAADLHTNTGIAVGRVHPYSISAEAFVETRAARQAWDVIVVDPPRHGLAAPVRGALAELLPKQIVYVSCDPTTLARDVAVLSTSGYQMESIHLIDLFPQTYHLEAIVKLAR